MSNSNNIKKIRALSVIFVFIPIIFYACNKDDAQRLGVDIPSDIKPVKLSKVLEAPGRYNGKQVVMKGVIAGQCASLCEFFFRDGVQEASIYPEGFKFPKLESGKPVSVYALVTAGPENVVFSALGVRVESGNKI